MWINYLCGSFSNVFSINFYYAYKNTLVSPILKVNIYWIYGNAVLMLTTQSECIAHKLRAQPYTRLAFLSMAAALGGPPTPPHFWHTGYKFEGSNSPSQVRYFAKMAYITQSAIVKITVLWSRIYTGWGLEGSTELPQSLPPPPLGTSMYSMARKLPWALLSRIFIGVSLHRHDRLIIGHVVDHSLQPPFSSQEARMDQSSYALITWLGFLLTLLHYEAV